MQSTNSEYGSPYLTVFHVTFTFTYSNIKGTVQPKIKDLLHLALMLFQTRSFLCAKLKEAE